MYSNRRKERHLDNGLIYFLISFIVSIIQKLSIVEWLKKIIGNIVWKRYKEKYSKEAIQRKQRFALNITIDVFIIFKFSLVALLWYLDFSSILSNVIIFYLLFYNLFTYFYHHLWSEVAIRDQYLTLHRVRRRFIALFLSIIYMIITYSYLYKVVFSENFIWSNNLIDSKKAILFSISNSFAGTYQELIPLNDLGEMIKVSQTIMMFIFITLILARSLPVAKN
ncbi:hypothetical protein ACFOZ1_08440 [Gracilibacillus marinus]|uniref:Potassium channel domain-containing protein n=1 Tax=Gracilibacillus marinus TaxID=630535 RepID=A0ABV8VYG6_9BACI